MNTAFFQKHRFALICAAGVVVVGGCYLIYQASQSRKSTTRNLWQPEHDDGTADLLGTNVDWEEEARKMQEELKTAEYEADDVKSNEPKDKSVIKFPVQVFVRLRPLIKEEIEGEHEEIEYTTKYIKKTKSTTINIVDITKNKSKRRGFIPKKKKKEEPKEEPKKLKKFKGFKGVLIPNDNNFECFKQAIEPSIGNIFNGYTVCSFAYGHTGSGKTYTILGYDPVESPGMYRLTAKLITDKIGEINKNINNEDDKMLISCRFAELYQGKMRDLFGNLVECQVRESDDGKIHIRGPTIKDEKTGIVKVSPLTPCYIGENEVDKLIEKVTESLKFRKQGILFTSFLLFLLYTNTNIFMNYYFFVCKIKGSSATHDESSRSHVFLDMELVTNRLIKARKELWDAEGEVVPVGKARTDQLIKIQSQQFKKNEETGEYEILKDFVPDKEEQAELARLQKETVRLEGIVTEKEEKIAKIMRESEKCIGGTIVFVDLAGNEWGSDSKNIKGDSNIQARERKEINKSLLSLKECVRALHLHKDHVPYRDSKLTMVLRPHLKGINSTAIMIANISPSKQHIQKTYNTLLYSQLVAKA